ncbi:hypothetical protein VTN49DRAFT_1479 [Thermomyces lanuginosus]|uniref:uncharacterized protein n=1 Tax=Thermomyces lanuginosus TaxID=5541 RepID=UPI0037445FFD
MAKRSRGDSFSTTSDTPTEASSRPSTPGATPPPAKINTLDRTSEEAAAAQTVIRCTLPPHREAIPFTTYEEYEIHYQQAHVNRCGQCGKNFPTARFLDLHIEENHDSLVLARRARGEKTYSCFVEGCDRKCSTPQKRRRHLIDKHMFPRTYNFFIVNDGIDAHSSLLRSSPQKDRNRRISAPRSPQEGRLRNRRTSVSSTPKENTSQESTVNGNLDVEESLSASLSALRFVPVSVQKRAGR